MSASDSLLSLVTGLRNYLLNEEMNISGIWNVWSTVETDVTLAH